MDKRDERDNERTGNIRQELEEVKRYMRKRRKMVK